MKSFFIIVAFFLSLSLGSKLRSTKSDAHKDINPEIVMTPTHELLPGTPKATTLKNHFGADPNDSPYGPQPTLIRTKVVTEYPDGTVKAVNSSEIVHLPDGVVSDCEISLQQYYPICFNLKSCDLCTANPYCGNNLFKGIGCPKFFKVGAPPPRSVSQARSRLRHVPKPVSTPGSSISPLAREE